MSDGTNSWDGTTGGDADFNGESRSSVCIHWVWDNFAKSLGRFLHVVGKVIWSDIG